MIEESAKTIPFQFKRKISSGRISDIFEAFSPLTQASVNLKILNPSLQNDLPARRKFLREAELQSRVSHPNVIQALDVIDLPDLCCIVLEPFDGVSLWHWLQEKGTLPPDELPPLITQLCAPVAAVHAAGIIHCDLKPLNLLISREESPLLKLTDFGEARLAGTAGAVSQNEEGIVWASPLYMSPEQCHGERLQKMTDVYSLGVILYQLTTGQLPFYSDDVEEMAGLHCGGEPQPPSQINPSIPLKMEKIILKAMRKDPKKRYPNASALLAAIQTVYN